MAVPKFKIISTIVFLSFLCIACTTKSENRNIPLNMLEISQTHILNFNSASYGVCRAKLKQCPAQATGSPLLEEGCVAKIQAEVPQCHQLSEISKEKMLESPNFDLLEAKEYKPFFLIKKIFPADGATVDYILTPQGELINTLVNPLSIIQTSQTQIQDKNYSIESTDAPTYISTKTLNSFVVPVRIYTSCRACENYATAVMRFDFEKFNSKLAEVRVEKFELKNYSKDE